MGSSAGLAFGLIQRPEGGRLGEGREPVTPKGLPTLSFEEFHPVSSSALCLYGSIDTATARAVRCSL